MTESLVPAVIMQAMAWNLCGHSKLQPTGIPTDDESRADYAQELWGRRFHHDPDQLPNIPERFFWLGSINSRSL